jgi:Na+/proline symporter
MARLVPFPNPFSIDEHLFLLSNYVTLFMSTIDWLVLVVTLCSIVGYGIWKGRSSRNLQGYFLSNRSMPWYLVLMGIMGTQASAITFLSAPGQAFTDGMRFVQYYFGLPLAMIVICISFVPLFNKLKVFTAYEYLEQRFDAKTRIFTASLFLLSRGLSTGISIYAPSLILSSILGWNIFWTNIFMGGLLIIYTMSGGARAVAYTQRLQFLIILSAMFLAGRYMVHALPEGVDFTDALFIGGAGGKMNAMTTGFSDQGFEWRDRYNIVSGLIGGFFLALSYFGTDQSQVGRYLVAKNPSESRLGLLLNGIIKVPMQFCILLIGVLLFAYYQFNEGPIFFNKNISEKILNGPYKDSLQQLEDRFHSIQSAQKNVAGTYIAALHNQSANAPALHDSVAHMMNKMQAIRNEYKTVLKKADASIDTNDTNYIFIRYVVDNLPVGLVGLIIAVIFLASWGSIAAALNSLAGCTMVDFYCRIKKDHPHATGDDALDEKRYHLSKWFTFGWGIFCIIVAQFSNKLGSLIEVVNIFGSLFYGVILGIFLIAFYLTSWKGHAVFWGAVIAEILVIVLFRLDYTGIIGFGFLWLNVVGAALVVICAGLIHLAGRKLT